MYKNLSVAMAFKDIAVAMTARVLEQEMPGLFWGGETMFFLE